MVKLEPLLINSPWCPISQSPIKLDPWLPSPYKID